MRDPQKVIADLQARCFRYKAERLILLQVINDLSAMLFDKFKQQNESKIVDKTDLDTSQNQ